LCKYCCVVLLILCLFSFSCFCFFCLCFCLCLCLCIWLCWFIFLFFCTSLQSNDQKTIGMASHLFASHILFLNKFLVSKKRFSWFWLLTSMYLVFGDVDMVFIKTSQFFEQLATSVFWLPYAGPPECQKFLWEQA